MGVAKTAPHLTSGRLLARNTIWNLLGLLTPMAVGALAIPPLVQELGVARFGVLSLAWIVIGYFSLFDLGIGRALTKAVADKLAANEEHLVPSLAWTSLLLMFVLGTIGGLVMAGIAWWLVHRMLNVPNDLQSETLWTFYLLAVSVPLVTVTSGLRGILEAQQRFRVLNLIRIPMSVFSFVGPLLVLPFSHSLVPVISVLVVGRIIGSVAHLLACFHSMPALFHNFILERSVVAPVVKFGGWMTVSNIIGPIMVYMDRFLIGALLSVGAIAYYTAPFDMVTRLWVIPGALVGVLFPAFAVTLVQDPARTGLLLRRGTKYAFLAIFPLVLVINTLAPEGLRLWLGEAFAKDGSSVLRWLAAGVFVNSLGQAPFVLVQSAGRADITAKLHLAELPFYLVAVWLLTKRLGIEGTAIAWAGRCMVDALLVCLLAHRLLPGKSRFLPTLGGAIAAGLLLLYLGTLPHTMTVKMEFLALALLGFGALGWLLILNPGERALLSTTGQVVGPTKAVGS
jgi:O-antigen/teichoic acid export membrane protein